MIQLLAARWGFAVVVAATIAVGLVAGMTVAIPPDVPSFALGAMPVYRIEVGAAVFVGLYLAATALVLAMHNRAFTELGTGGIRASGLAVEEEEGFEELVLELMDEVRSLQARRKEKEDGSRKAT